MRQIRSFLLFGPCILGPSMAHAQLSVEHRFIYPAANTTALLLADVDNDGDGDAVRVSDGTLYMQVQDAPSVFRTLDLSIGTGLVDRLRSADLDGDGINDLVFNRRDAGAIAVVRVLGGGSFGPMTDVVTGITEVFDVRAGDMDADGDLDLVYSFDLEHVTIGWVANQGDGTFGTPQGFVAGVAYEPYPEQRSHFDVGDIDLDGDMDIVALGPPLEWWENDGSGGFTTHVIDGAAINLDVCLADVIGDGHPDVVVCDAQVVIACYMNEGSSGFAAMVGLFGPGDELSARLTAADADGDGDVDLFCRTLGGLATENKVLLGVNQGSGAFEPVNLGFGADDAQVFATGDVDGNATIDVIGRANQGIHLMQDLDPNTLRLTSIAPTGITPIDVDNDGAMDVAVSAYAQDSPIAEGEQPWGFALHINGGGGLVDASPKAASPSVLSVLRTVAGDVDSDGDDDLMALWRDPLGGAMRSWFLLRNEGGTLDSVANVSTVIPYFQEIPNTLELVDMDNDGDLDAVNDLTGFSWVYLNDGTGVFAPPLFSPLSATPYIASCLTMLDMDGDDLPDHVWGHANEGGLGADSLFRNMNDGTGAAGAPVFAGFSPTSVFPHQGAHINSAVLRNADLDLDGVNDLIVFNGDSIGVLRNPGTGTFGTGQALQATGTQSIALGDLNGDGRPDLIAIRANGDVLFWANTGNCTFGEMTILATALTQSGTDDIALADMDGDGDLDVLTCSANGAAAWLENEGDLPTGIPDAVAATSSSFLIVPNPVNENTRIILGRPLSLNGRVDVIDACGRNVRRFHGNGSNMLVLPSDGLLAGVYIVRISDGNAMIATARMVVAAR